LCTSLTNATIGNNVISIAAGAFASCTSLTSIAIPNSATNIGDAAFMHCSSLTSATAGNSVTSIGEMAFYDCTSLTSIYFQGNAPGADSSVFDGANYTTVYYLPGTTGWGPFFANRPTVLWNPQVQPGSFGIRTNQFAFTITGISNLVVVIEASTNLTDATWSPLATNTLSSGSFYFTEPQWTNYASRFYRLRMP
jgi:hypothetical protein